MTSIALPAPRGSRFARSIRRSTSRVATTLLAVAVLSGFLLPLGYMALTALKSQAQITDSSAPVYPATQRTFT